MIRKEFPTRQEVDSYLTEQRNRQEKGYLTRSEREELKQLLEHPETLIKKEVSKGKSIITNIIELRKPCLVVEKNEDINQIIQDLKDTLNTFSNQAYGLAANQIGYNKSICYLRIPKINEKTKQVEYEEFAAINPKVLEKERKIIFKQEGCLSFRGLRIDTDRYVFCVIQYENEKREIQNVITQDLAAFIWQHEIGHLQGKTILDFKHKGR